MKRLITFGTGMAVGYVLGAKAGRGRYEQIMAIASDLPSHVPHSVDDMTGRTSRKVGDLTETARSAAHSKVHDLTDVADQTIDDVAVHAHQVRLQSEERLTSNG
jgi:hypothetical protein